MAAIRMYQNQLFEEVSRDAATVTGYRCDGHTGRRIGGRITVPAAEVTLTGDDAYALEVGTMSALALLDAVMANPEYLTDPYYRDLGDALRGRHDALQRERQAADAPDRDR